MEIYTTYKDRVFRLLFRERKYLLELYNALNGTNLCEAFCTLQTCTRSTLRAWSLVRGD